MSLQGPWRRVLYVALYEGIAIAVVTLAFVAGDESVGSASGVAVGSSLIAVVWNLVFNALFERWKAATTSRFRTNRPGKPSCAKRARSSTARQPAATRRHPLTSPRASPKCCAASRLANRTSRARLRCT